MNNDIGRDGTGDYAGLVWNGKQWVQNPNQQPPRQDAGAPPVGAVWNGSQWVLPAQPPARRQGSAKVVIGLLLVVLVVLVASCQAMSSQPSAPAPPCPESTATTLTGSFSEGLNKGLSGCR